MRFVTKLLVYRLGASGPSGPGDGQQVMGAVDGGQGTGDVGVAGGGVAAATGDGGGDGGDPGGTLETIEALVDVVENYAHPSNSGAWTKVLALFLQGLVKYVRKRVASKKHAPLPDDVAGRFARCVTRLVDKGMYSKNATMRHAASSAAGQLAYLRPAAVLPLVMARFMEAVEHSTATHQLNAALSMLTSCLRPMLSAPPEAFLPDASAPALGLGQAAGPVPSPAQYLAAALDATLPGIDANDPSKTLGTIRLYVAVVSNMACLADPGQAGACEAFPFVWSEWIDALLQRFFAFFHNVDASKATQADGADKHRGGAGGDGGASLLMGASSMYSPLMRLVFARMHPRLRLRAVKRVAHFVLNSTHSGLTGEVGQMVMAAATQAPDEAVPYLTRPLLDALAAEVEDVCKLVADNEDGILSADKIVSPTKEAKLRWQTGLLGAGMHYGGPRVVTLSEDIRGVLRKLFGLCHAAKSLPLGDMGAHLASLLCGSMTGTYINDLFAPDDHDHDRGGEGREGAPLPSTWVVTKVYEEHRKKKEAAAEEEEAAGMEEGSPSPPLPRPFLWRRPAPEELAVAARMSEEFLEAPSKALLQAFGEGGDGAMSKEKVRALLAMIGGTASGFRTRMADFAPNPAEETLASGHSVPAPVGPQDVIPPAVSVEVRSLAASAVVRRARVRVFNDAIYSPPAFFFSSTSTD